MFILLGSIVAAVAVAVLFRLLRQPAGPARTRTLVTLGAAALVLGVALLAATGRLHWLAVVFAALLPLLRRGLSLFGYLPLFKRLFGRTANAQQRASSGSARMTREQAIDILGLGTRPSREEVLSAHRRLIQKLHPDHGGSNFLAQQLNEAKRTLLDGMTGD